MRDRSKVLRGDAWALRLQGHLSAPPDEIQAWMREHSHPLKAGTSSCSGLLRLGGDLCFLKFYRYQTPLHRWAMRLRPPAAVRAYDAAAALRWQGIAVPRPRACLRLDRGMLLLAKGIEGSENLHYLWQGGLKYDLASHLMWAAGDEVAQMHSVGFAHGNMKWSNMLWGRDRLYLTHLEGVSRAPAKKSAQWQDLARFTVDAEEMGLDAWHYEQFLESYMRQMQIDRDVIVASIKAPLNRLRNQHWADYGAYGTRLV